MNSLWCNIRITLKIENLNILKRFTFDDEGKIFHEVFTDYNLG